MNAHDAGDRRSEGCLGGRPLEGLVEEAPRYRLRPSVELFPAAAGDVYLLRPGAPAAVVRAPEPADRALLERLAVEAVPAPAATAVAGRLAPLQAAGLLVREPDGPPLEPEEAERFARQLPYFAETGDPLAIQRRLRATHVAVIGCGGLGTWALGALASLGVGRPTHAIGWWCYWWDWCEPG